MGIMREGEEGGGEWLWRGRRGRRRRELPYHWTDHRQPMIRRGYNVAYKFIIMMIHLFNLKKIDFNIRRR